MNQGVKLGENKLASRVFSNLILYQKIGTK